MDSDTFDNWLSLDQCEFVGRVYDLTMPIHLGEHDYDTLVSIAPDRAYVLDVHGRLHRLVDRFHSLNTIFEMLAVDSFPLPSRRGSISREAWVRIILDVLLTRITSVRDCTYLLIAEVFELGMDERSVSRKTLQKNQNIPSNPFHVLIDDFASIGRNLRDERDHHLHRGEERPLGADPTTYRIASFWESLGKEITGTGRDGKPIDLIGKHQKIVDEIEQEFSASTRDLDQKLRELFDALYPVFLQRFRTKRRLSKLD